MDLSCPDESHPFSQPLLSSADAGWELPFHQISCSSGRTWVSLWALKANGPASRAAWIFTVLKCPDILLLLQRQKRSYFWGFFWKQEGKPSSFLFVCSCAICGCFYGESTARMELNCQTCDRLPMSIIEVLQAAGSWSPRASVKWGLCDRVPMGVHEPEAPQTHGTTVLLHSQLQPWPPMGFGISFFFRTFSSCTCLLT